MSSAPRRSARLAAKKTPREAPVSFERSLSPVQNEKPSSTLPAPASYYPKRHVTCREVNTMHLAARESHERLLNTHPLERWEPASQEAYDKSLAYLHSMFSEENMGTADHLPKNHSIIIDIYRHLAEQPIVLAAAPVFREKAVKKVNEIMGYICKKKDMELMALYSPFFNEFSHTAKAIELHPWYKE